MVYTMNRHQDVLQLYAVNPRSTVSQLLIKESVPKYVKEDAMGNIRLGKDYILVPSDRDGYMHLYLYDNNGKMIRQLEKGNYDVTGVYGYDEKNKTIYYQAAALNPHDRQVYAVTEDGRVSRLTNQ